MNNMKTLLTTLLLFLAAAAVAGEPEKLSFNKEGEFKIVQFTDLHLGKDAAKNQAVYDLMGSILDEEKPDFVVLSGDVVTHDSVQARWDALVQVMSSRDIRWTAVLGNHDEEHKLSRREIQAIIAGQPGAVMNPAPEDVAGACNQVIAISGSKGNGTEALLYFFDTHAYTRFKGIGKYDWVDLSQLVWYRDQSRAFTEANGGEPLPALAFFHIPLPEYLEAWNSMETNHWGTRNEKGGWPYLNSGLFTQFVEAGDVMATFAGHDHVNDYIACLYGIALAYGRGTGGATTYGDQVPGARVIVLHEGERTFDTWIRERGNDRRVDECTYPSSFENKGPGGWMRRAMARQRR